MKATASSKTWPHRSAPPAADRGRESGFHLPRPARRSGESGFTLLEVMVALAIVAIALVSLLGLSSRTLTVNDRVEHITRATLLAQQRLAELDAGVPLHEGDQELQGTFPAPFADYRWRLSYQDTPLPAVQQVTVVVAWGAEAKNEAVEISSFAFRKGISL
jgi:general secretion pathway protein I